MRLTAFTVKKAIPKGQDVGSEGADRGFSRNFKSFSEMGPGQASWVLSLSGILSVASHYFMFLPVVSLNTRRVKIDAHANGESRVWHAVATERVQHNKVLKNVFPNT